MKKLIAILLCMAMLCGITACGTTDSSQSGSTGMQDGTYTATEFGMMGDVVVTLTVEGGKITTVEAVGESETAGIGTLALEQLPAAIVEAQSADVDGVATATVTSDAIKAAAQACIDQAMGIAGEGDGKEIPTEADVIVVGGGAAGLSAASAACEAGASVIVLEAAGHTGGAAALSAGNIDSTAADTLEALGRNDDTVKAYLDYTAEDFPAEYADDLAKVQADVTAYLADTSVTSAYDSVERIMLDHYKKGQGTDLDGVPATLNYDYIREGVEANEEIRQWLLSSGLEFAEPANQHFIAPVGGGTALTDTLLSMAESAGAQVLCNARVNQLVVDDQGTVVGVVAEIDGENVTFTAKSGVVLATGGFSANAEMVAEYQNVAPGLTADNGSTNPPTNVGDGIKMAQELGAQLQDMQFVGFLWRGYKGLATGTEATQIGNAKQLAVNMEGVRFTDDTAANLQAAALNQTNAVACMVGDSKMYDALESEQAGLVADLESRGVVFTGDTLEEAAEKAGIDAETLTATVESFNAMVDKGEDPEFGRTEFNGKVEQAPFVIAKTQAVNHLTYGGLVTDGETRVLREDGTAISGLYAAGDVVSGYEGYAHQTGECLTIVMYYGQKAGTNAAAGITG